MEKKTLKDEQEGFRQKRFVELMKKAAVEEVLGEGGARLAAIVDHSEDAIIGKDLAGLITDWNRGAEKMYGYTAAEVKGRPISILAPPGKDDELSSLLGKIKEGESIRHYETLRVRKDGRQIWVSLTISPIRNQEGRVIGASTIARNITRQKQAEACLRESEERLSLALEAARDGVWDWHINGDTYLSPKYFEMTGYAPGEVRPDPAFFRSIIHPEDVERVMKTMEDHLQGRTGQSVVEYRMITKSGACRHILGKGRVVERDETGKPLRMIGTISDITERKQVEELLVRSEKKLRDITSSLGEGIYVMDRQGQITFMNPMAERLFGWSMEELNRSGPHSLVHYRKADGTPLPFEDCGMHNVINTGETYASADDVFVRKDGAVFPVSVTSTPVFENGRIVASVTAFRDITDRKKLEKEREELIRSLTEALANLRVLSGMLPICASCKKIRDDKGYWNQLEAFITDHSDVLFSHGLCPDCARKALSEIDELGTGRHQER